MNDEAASTRIVGRTLFEVLFTRPKTIALIAVVLLVLISAWPPFGVIIGFVFLLAALLLARRQGSFPEIGFRRPESWTRTILLGALIGVAIQLVFSIVVDPLLERLAGSPVDLSNLDGMRGHLANYLVMLAVGWVIGGFLEEMLFRGYLLGRIRRVLGDGPVATALAILLPALAFGLSHAYQDTAGMLSTGLIGALFGIAFVWYRGNLWLPILVHGFSNVAGITLIYTSLDKVLNQLLFP
jgi:membrane protease YdiL (CAAX protease family)